jgi:NAD+ synthase (glutamine-hydrolysing)
LQCPFILCNQVGGNDSLLFDGCSYALNQKGDLISIAKGFEEDLLIVDTNEEKSPLSFQPNDTEDLFKALVLGIRDYFKKTGIKQACLGLSGGIDSAVVACIAVAALGKENVLCVSMPSRYTTEASKKDARLLANHLGTPFKEIPIEEPFSSFLHLLDPYFEGKKEDITEENLQARVRGVLLMALSNKFGHMVLNTGNKSEMAMGYMTLYGDMCGGLGVLSDVTKCQVYALAKWISRETQIIPHSILEKVPSAELRHNQKDTDTLPEYRIVDKVLESYVEEHLAPQEIAQKYGIDLSLVLDLVKRIHLNEYKRRQAPPALRVTKKAFTVGRRFPIAQKWNI